MDAVSFYRKFVQKVFVQSLFGLSENFLHSSDVVKGFMQRLTKRGPRKILMVSDIDVASNEHTPVHHSSQSLSRQAIHPAGHFAM